MESHQAALKRLLVGLVAALVASLLSAAPAAAQTGVFDDVADDAYYWVSVGTLAEDGVFAGTECDDGRFCPSESLDRQTMAVWTVRVLDDADPAEVSATRFSDAEPDSFYAPFIERMAELSVTAGCGDGTRFCPDRTVTRAQMAVFLTRAFSLAPGPDPGFSDVPADAWYFDQVAALAASGITAGCRDGTWFCPHGETTRAQMATYLYRALQRDGESGGDADTQTGTDEPDSDPAHGASVTVAPTVEPPLKPPLSWEQALQVAERLAPHLVLPGDCKHSPLNRSGWLPNALRPHRGGTHQGVDFHCPRGHPVVAVLDGHVVVAVGDYEDASSQRLNEVLSIAAKLGYTPPYTLVMLYGNRVVVDHGIIASVGHAVSIYAHLEAIDPAVSIGGRVTAGQLLGQVGNSGTTAAAAGQAYQTVHLHWELHINGQYLGAGLSPSDTRSVYAALFNAAGQ